MDCGLTDSPIMFDPHFLGHGNNIAQKLRSAPDDRLRKLCEDVQDRYDAWVSNIFLNEVCSGDFESSVAALNEYVEYTKAIEKAERFFNWRSDFASSVIPEYLYRITAARLHQDGIAALFSTRSSVVEVTLASNAVDGWNIRRKNQDLCIGLRTASLPVGSRTENFVVPQIVFEVKTNIDINKLNGLDFSAERLKKSFPAANYMLLTETIDFSLNDNYAAGSIDEIYVGRKQLRSNARRNKAPLCSDVFRELVEDVSSIMRKASLDRGHVYQRLTHGRLINVT